MGAVSDSGAWARGAGVSDGLEVFFWRFARVDENNITGADMSKDQINQVAGVALDVDHQANEVPVSEIRKVFKKRQTARGKQAGREL